MQISLTAKEHFEVHKSLRTDIPRAKHTYRKEEKEKKPKKTCKNGAASKSCQKRKRSCVS